jgi:hypothetical protein
MDEPQKGTHDVSCDKCKKPFGTMTHFGGENILASCGHCEGGFNLCPDCWLEKNH